MKNFIITLAILLLLPISPTLSGACSGVKFKFTWKEPKVDINGTALTDLSKTTLYYQINDSSIIKKNYTATKASGDGSKTASITIPMNCKTNVNLVTVWTTATNAMGESASSNKLLINVPIIRAGSAL